MTAPTPPAPGGHVVRLATPDDARAYTHCYVESLAETYAHIMPPAFAEHRRETFEREAAATHDELVAMHRALDEGREPGRTHWVGLDDGGEVAGIVSAGPGVPSWEAQFYSNPEPPVRFNLDHLYTLRSTHGSGLGQQLMDTALAMPEPTGDDAARARSVQPGSTRGRGAWLWILRRNPRAEAFYRRNGFVPDGLEVRCGASWFHAPMFRMWRPDPR